MSMISYIDARKFSRKTPLHKQFHEFVLQAIII